MNMLFGCKPTVVQVPSDRVLPLHFFESGPIVQGNNMAMSIVFDDVLDPESLRRSLEDLVKREGWQRFGGRLRKNVRINTNSNICGKRPHGSPGTKPGGIQDYLTSDRPVLGLRVNSFTDKTIATLQWQHVAFDELGMQYVIEGWSYMLWGKAVQIPTPCRIDSDPFDALAQGTRPATEEHLLADKRVGLSGMLKWGLGYGVDMLVRAKEDGMVCVPETYWRPQREGPGGAPCLSYCE
ncbi:hypothetical protein EDB80DRAFT_809394 [Ilyonectria destructans]|nr:hypothetical protein EDB80DRAFT_809394 [Ilyonectria destructans]